MVQTHILNTWKTNRRIATIWSSSGLHSEVQVSQGCLMKPYLKEVSIRINIQTSSSLWHIDSKYIIKIYNSQNVYKNVHSKILHNNEIWREAKWSSVSRWISSAWSNSPAARSSAVKGLDHWHAALRVNLEHTALTERKQNGRWHSVSFQPHESSRKCRIKNKQNQKQSVFKGLGRWWRLT